MREVQLKDLTLTLSSKDSEDLYDRLSGDGLLSEYLSGLFNERAGGIAAEEFVNLKGTVVSLETTIATLQKTIELLVKSGVGAGNVAAIPTNNSPVASVPKEPQEIKKVSIDSKSVKGGGMSMLSKMAQTRNKKGK